MTDWYRTADWDDVARSQFEQRLKRARASSRCQYLSIKAQALAEAGLLDEARELLGRAVSVPDSYSFEIARAYELLSDLARQQGRLAEAEDHYRRVLASAPDGSGTSELVVASRDTCAARYEDRRSRAEVEEAASYSDVIADPTEASVDSLGALADIWIDTDQNSPEDVIVRVAAQLGLLDRDHAPTVDVLVGGGYGSEGKGNIAFHLAPEYDLLIRGGGPNAAHKVYLASGEIFTQPAIRNAGRDSAARARARRRGLPA